MPGSHTTKVLDRPLPSQPSEEVNRLFRTVLESATFKAAPVMRSLLSYLWEHQGESINEYSIAIDALGRPSDFDPKLDANVRVQIARLRQKLNECYNSELKSFPLRLTIPRGSHDLNWSYDRKPVSLLSVVRELPSFQRIAIGSGLLLCICLVCLNVVLLWQNRSLKASLRVVTAPSFPGIWKSFLVGGKTPMIVVPSVSAFRWPNNSILVRDTKIGALKDWSTSPFIRQLAEKWGPPMLHQDYVLGVEVGVALRIQEYLEKLGERPEVIESRYVPADSGSTRNRIFLGAPHLYGPDDPVRQALAKTNFSISADPNVIENRSPRSSESREYRVANYSPDHRVVPELIILLPPIPGGGRTMLLLGPQPTAFLSLLLSQEGLSRIDDVHTAEGSPGSWEMLIQAEVNGDTVLKVAPVAMRPVPESFWN